jgi:TonB family protein
MKRLLWIIICIIPGVIAAQEIQFMNEAGNKVSKKDAKFYREVYWDSIQDNAVLVIKYGKKGKPIEAGHYDTNDLKEREGEIIEYDELGNIIYKKKYKNNKLDGELIGYHLNGQIRRKDLYRNDSLLSGHCFTSSGTDTNYYPMMIKPKFKGGHAFDIRFFILENFRYPYKAMAKGIEGDVQVYFCVDKSGEVRNVKVAESDNVIFNKEAIRLIKKSSGFWEPGYIEGKPAMISYIIPIKYRLK